MMRPVFFTSFVILVHISIKSYDLIIALSTNVIEKGMTFFLKGRVIFAPIISFFFILSNVDSISLSSSLLAEYSAFILYFLNQ